MISTTCTTCHSPIHVAVTDCRIVVGPGAELLVMQCATCDAPVAKHLGEQMKVELLRLGTAVEGSRAQTPYPERVDRPEAPRFSVDDVLDLHAALSSPTWAACLLGIGA